MNEKFNPEIWGTVSDWAMVVVTAFTAVFLIKSFIEQSRSNQLSLDNYKRSIRPKFYVDQNQDYVNQGGNIEVMVLILKITLEENDARNFSSEKMDDSVSYNQCDRPYIKKGEEIIYQTSKLYNNKERLNILEIFFSDIEGNKYRQKMYVENGVIALENPVPNDK